MQNARLDKTEDGIKIVGEISITSDKQKTTTIMAESKEELKSLLISAREE